MGRGILKAQLRDFDQIGQRADCEIRPRRREKYDLKYDYADAIKSAYGVGLESAFSSNILLC
ncbi:MAG: hypothetical protein LBD44_06300 [Spirochaetaceae bacterium]|jgi:hypothetical protein|nr:hypothetical protein [Spirochaetaceae bacterium]